MKKKAKLTFKNKVRRRGMVRDERSNGRRGSGRWTELDYAELKAVKKRTKK